MTNQFVTVTCPIVGKMSPASIQCWLRHCFTAYKAVSGGLVVSILVYSIQVLVMVLVGRKDDSSTQKNTIVLHIGLTILSMYRVYIILAQPLFSSHIVLI